MEEHHSLKKIFRVSFGTILLAILILIPATYIAFHPAPAVNSTVNPSLQKAIELASNSPGYDSYLDLSMQFYTQKEYEKTIVYSLKAIAFDPNGYRAYNNLCAAYCELNMPDEAIEAAETALKIKPDFQLAKNNLEWAKKIKEKK